MVPGEADADEKGGVCVCVCGHSQSWKGSMWDLGIDGETGAFEEPNLGRCLPASCWSGVMAAFALHRARGW